MSDTPDNPRTIEVTDLTGGRLVEVVGKGGTMQLQATPPECEFEHYHLGVWQMIEDVRYWIDGEERSQEQINACVNNLVDNCRQAAGGLEDGADNDEKFKIQAVSRLLNVLGYHGKPPAYDDDGDPMPF